MWYRVFPVGLKNRNLVSCSGYLEALCVGDGYGCRHVGVVISLGRVIEALRSLRRIFALIIVGRVLPIFFYILST